MDMLRRFGKCDRYRQLLMFIGIDRIELTQRAIRVELETQSGVAAEQIQMEP